MSDKEAVNPTRREAYKLIFGTAAAAFAGAGVFALLTNDGHKQKGSPPEETKAHTEESAVMGALAAGGGAAIIISDELNDRRGFLNSTFRIAGFAAFWATISTMFTNAACREAKLSPEERRRIMIKEAGVVVPVGTVMTVAINSVSEKVTETVYPVPDNDNP